MHWLPPLLLGLAACCTAQAATYSYRADTYSWESAAHTISNWDSSCSVDSGNDDGRATLSFANGFTFPFNGVNYSSVRVFVDGMVQFSAADAGAQRIASPTNLPMAAPPAKAGCPGAIPQGMLLVYWKNLKIDNEPLLSLLSDVGISWEQKGSAPNRYFVVTWYDVFEARRSLLGGLFPAYYNFQLILYENGEFKYQYDKHHALVSLFDTMYTDGSDATVGVQVSGSDTTLYSYKQPVLSVGQAIRWYIPTVLHHLQISGASNQGVTCAPASFTLKACADAACSSLVTTGITGSLSGSNAATLWPGGTSFNIPAGQGSISFNLQLPVAGSTTLGATSTAPLAAAATGCDFDAACKFSASSSALLLSVPNHAAASAGVNLSVSAVRSSADSTRCLPAFGSVTRSLKLSCGYSNPATGTLWPSIGGGICNAAGSTVSASFNAAGNASLPFSYVDVGQLAVNASYTGSAANGDAGLVMSGSTSVIAAPASFSVGAFTSPLVAGRAFGAQVKALNAAGAVTPNFMRESTPATPALSFTRSKPTGVGASDGSFSGSLASVAAGVMTVANAVWSEVGQGLLGASVGNYLGSGLGASGSATTGTFIPHHFDVALSNACGSFTYAGQPFAVTVTARNGLASPGTTLNYDGGTLTPAYAQASSYSAAQAIGAGSFSPPTLPASAFDHGVATVNALSYAFSSKLTAPGVLQLRVVDANGVSSAGGSEASTLLRSGRLRISSNTGPGNAPLSLPVQAQFWTGSAWVRNSDDSCTVLPAGAVVRFNPLTLAGTPNPGMNNTAAGFNVVNGQAAVPLSAASPASSGTLDVGLNLGNNSNAQLCSSASIPASSGAQLPWLRSQNGSVGSCGATWDRDPAARATFGLGGAESGKFIDARIPF